MRTELVVIALTCIGILIGAVGPWATAAFASKAGLEGDGVITLVLGVVAIAVLVPSVRANDRRAWTAAVGCGLLICAVAGYDVSTISDTKTELFGEEIQVINVGWGLWLTLLSGITMVGAGISLRR